MIHEELLIEAEKRALDFAQNENFCGSDPYDGLTSPFAKFMIGRMPRQAWVQLHKRTGLRTRGITQVNPIRMTKALALFAQGTSLVGRESYASKITSQILVEKGSGPWGYEFDVQTRWAHYLAGSPNVIATVFTLRATDATNHLVDVSPQVAEWLSELVHEDGYFKYTSASDRLIHNGNLLAAEGFELMGGESSTIIRAIDTTVDRQRTDGSWRYGEGTGLEWIDSFHTIYNLQALIFLRGRGYDVGDALERGYEYWLANCLTKDLLPTYFAGQAEPSRDVHNIATTVGFLAQIKLLGWDSPDPTPAIKFLLQHQGNDGAFRNGPKKPPHMRWNQGHAYLAISRWMQVLGLQTREDGDTPNQSPLA